jgi:Flp pilus assembly protein CpaB
MNRKFNPVIVVGALLLVVGIAVLAVLAARGGDTKTREVKAVVASDNIVAGTTGETAKVKVQDVPASSVPVGSYLDPAALKGTVALRNVPRGEVISTSAFGVLGQTTDHGVTLPTGKQGLGIELGFAPGALRYVVPGNKVVVWASRRVGDSAVTTQVVKDVLVMATTPGAGNGNATGATAGPGNLDFLLAVSPQEAAKLIAAQAAGQSLYVTLSNSSR